MQATVRQYPNELFLSLTVLMSEKMIVPLILNYTAKDFRFLYKFVLMSRKAHINKKI